MHFYLLVDDGPVGLAAEGPPAGPPLVGLGPLVVPVLGADLVGVAEAEAAGFGAEEAAVGEAGAGLALAAGGAAEELVLGGAEVLTAGWVASLVETVPAGAGLAAGFTVL